ncbi:MAG: Sjogren's syndrome/scleroderma autoantigen 1 family protein [Candidatus Lokiarchaeia archaeon]
MADLLRSGNKMLNMACPVCNNPLFRNIEEITFCPTCNRKIIIVDDKTNQDDRIKEDEINSKKSREEGHLNRHNELLTLLENVLYEKIEMIAKKLESETQFQMIETYNKTLSNCIVLLNKISILKDTK